MSNNALARTQFGKAQRHGALPFSMGKEAAATVETVVEEAAKPVEAVVEAVAPKTENTVGKAVIGALVGVANVLLTFPLNKVRAAAVWGGDGLRARRRRAAPRLPA